jgi:hypothetical protein
MEEQEEINATDESTTDDTTTEDTENKPMDQ